LEERRWDRQAPAWRDRYPPQNPRHFDISKLHAPKPSAISRSFHLLHFVTPCYTLLHQIFLRLVHASERTRQLVEWCYVFREASWSAATLRRFGFGVFAIQSNFTLADPVLALPSSHV
jgi:hypothetical protein